LFGEGVPAEFEGGLAEVGEDEDAAAGVAAVSVEVPVVGEGEEDAEEGDEVVVGGSGGERERRGFLQSGVHLRIVA
jgi:hypothetical protein